MARILDVGAGDVRPYDQVGGDVVREVRREGGGIVATLGRLSLRAELVDGTCRHVEVWEDLAARPLPDRVTVVRDLKRPPPPGCRCP